MRTLVAVVLLIAGPALAQESKLALKDGPGKEKAQVCVACQFARPLASLWAGTTR